MSRLWSEEHRAAKREAQKQKRPRFEGPPCRVCNSTERWASSGACVACHKRHAIELKKKRPLHRAVRGAEWRAKRDGLAFDLCEDDLVIPDVCPVLGCPMDTPSLDRRDNNLGYTMANVRVISWEANRLKHRLTLKQVEALAEYMRN